MCSFSLLLKNMHFFLSTLAVEWVSRRNSETKHKCSELHLNAEWVAQSCVIMLEEAESLNVPDSALK